MAELSASQSSIPQRKERYALGWMRDNASVVIGLTFLTVLLFCSFVAPMPYEPTRPDPFATSQPPSLQHWFGTDGNGFDVFSRTIASAQRDIPLAIAGTLASLLVGATLGLLASTKSRGSEYIVRTFDVLQAFPMIIVATAVVTLMGNKLENVVLAIVLLNVPRFLRLIRSEALVIRESRFVEAAQAIGAGPGRILLRHILPNVIGTMLAQCSIAAAHSIIVIAALSFIGVGVSPPDPSWGLMIQEGARQLIVGRWWIVAFPGLAVLLSVAAFNLVADGLQRRYE